jgi:hypothetical protein
MQRGIDDHGDEAGVQGDGEGKAGGSAAIERGSLGQDLSDAIAHSSPSAA